MLRFFANKKKPWIHALWISALFFVLFCAFVALKAEKKIGDLVVGGLGESFSTKVFAEPLRVRNGQFGSLDWVLTRLERLDYEISVETLPLPGEFRREEDLIEVYLRGFQTPTTRQNALLVGIQLTKDGTLVLRDATGNEIYEFYLEPELAAELSGPKKIRREAARWEEIPSSLSNAVVAAEDHKFFSHLGIRPLAIARAFLHNVRSSGPLHGGSTITQQLAKNLFLTPERTIKRKVIEAFYTLYLEVRFSKEKILTLYLNHIYMGQDGLVSVAGVKAATEFYFQKDLSELTIGESAVLAGLIRSPYRYNPKTHPENARTRRNFVLKNMLEQKFITPEEFEEALNEPVFSPAHQENGDSTSDPAYFVAEILRRLSPLYGEEALVRYGLTIYSTIDPTLQENAQKAVRRVSKQGALISMDPFTGRVRALVGGKNFKESQFNRATQAFRQPGSAFKPFVYAAAMEKGFSPNSFIQDEFREYPGKEDDEIWAPKNFDDVYKGTVTLRAALAGSKNAATLDLIQKIKPQTALDFAKRMGIQAELKPTLALALGVYETTLLDLTAAYAPFINGGFRVEPMIVESVIDSSGQVIELEKMRKTSVLDPGLAFLTTTLLQEVVSTGTARSLPQWGWKKPTAGKTGTTNGGKDAWFIGYTPYALTGVWVGDDEAKAIRASGSAHALPVWAMFMKSSYQTFPDVEFERPTGLRKVKIDPVTNQLAQMGCPESMEDWLLPEMIPETKCELHAGGIKGFFQKLFRKKL